MLSGDWNPYFAHELIPRAKQNQLTKQVLKQIFRSFALAISKIQLSMIPKGTSNFFTHNNLILRDSEQLSFGQTYGSKVCTTSTQLKPHEVGSSRRNLTFQSCQGKSNSF